MDKRVAQAFRSVLSTFVALCVALAPLGSLSVPAKASVAHVITSGQTLDCHGMKAQPSAPIKHEKPCPHCKGNVCTSDMCKLKCSKIMGSLLREPKAWHYTPVRVGLTTSPDFHYVQIRPPLPPPRV